MLFRQLSRVLSRKPNARSERKPLVLTMVHRRFSKTKIHQNCSKTAISLQVTLYSSAVEHAGSGAQFPTPCRSINIDSASRCESGKAFAMLLNRRSIYFAQFLPKSIPIWNIIVYASRGWTQNMHVKTYALKDLHISSKFLFVFHPNSFSANEGSA